MDGGGDREAHNVEEIAFDAGDPASGVALDAVGPGFVEAVAGGEVVGEVGFGDWGEEDAGSFYVCECGVVGDHGDTGVDVVDVAGESSEHAFGVGEVSGFVEDFLCGGGGIC